MVVMEGTSFPAPEQGNTLIRPVSDTCTAPDWSGGEICLTSIRPYLDVTVDAIKTKH